MVDALALFCFSATTRCLSHIVCVLSIYSVLPHFTTRNRWNLEFRVIGFKVNFTRFWSPLGSAMGIPDEPQLWLWMFQIVVEEPRS